MKTVKDAVLAKCKELGKLLVNDVADFGKYHIYKDPRSINSPWNIWGSGFDFHVDISIPDDADVWPLASQILGIKERPTNDLLWVAFKEGFCYIQNASGINIVNIDDIGRAKFDAWIATLPTKTTEPKDTVNR
jgi:hypothetical protein